MSVHEFVGKTTEDAINRGLMELGVTIADVKVEVLEEGAKGLFGLFGSKQAKVRMTLEDNSREESVDALLHSLSLNASAEKADRKKAPKPAPKPPAPARAKAPAPPKEPPVQAAAKQPATPAPKASEEAALAVGPGKDSQAQVPANLAPVQPAPRGELPTPELRDPATPEGRAQQFLMELTRRMNVHVAVASKRDEEGNVFVQMTGDTLGILIGRRGETLDALQYLTSLYVNKDSEQYTRVTLDTENYRAKREESLRRLASRMAARAVKTNRRVSLEPMNPYERRILHASLQGHPQVTTHSEGEEPNRHVVIVLKSAEK